jgi:AcrR family transcriptional regulator
LTIKYNLVIIMSEHSLYIFYEGVDMTPTRQERKENITRMRKQQILDAALKVFSNKGFAEATTTEIAQEAGVAEGTIYNYYQSKRELLVAVVKTFVMTESFLNLFENVGKMDYPVFLTAVLNNRMDFIEDNVRSHMLLLIGEILRDPELREIYDRQVIKPVMNQMEKYLENKAAKGEFRSVNTSVVTRALGGMVLGLLLLALFEGESNPLVDMPRQNLAAEIGQLVMKGIQQSQEFLNCPG